MAKFGEGDSRWIVEDRADGKNVNSWHWEEKNITPKAKERFIFHLNTAVLVENEGGVTVTVDGVDVTAAEATMMNRRGRMRCIFEITAKVKWTGSKVAADGEKLGSANGSYEIEEFTHDGPEECEIKSTLNDSKPGVPAEIYAVVKSAGIKSLKAKLSAFLQETIAACLNVDESRKAAGVPATGASPSPSPSPSPVVAKKSLEQSPATSNATFQTITSSYDFASEPQNLFECFVDVARFCAITQGLAKVSANAGGEIEFFNGSVTGSVVESVSTS
eukprot:TRINITY_DN4083_c0_g1_i2.p1 TRINITY_DN4083_c0_g1~~TRINITY_DN4083_c0_g1_i2.p1  ORF type:complete len:275 (+),score=70.08 TRINITY_DN4083_c0_g1_i2:63-887(+)